MADDVPMLHRFRFRETMSPAPRTMVFGIIVGGPMTGAVFTERQDGTWERLASSDMMVPTRVDFNIMGVNTNG